MGLRTSMYHNLYLYDPPEMLPSFVIVIYFQIKLKIPKFSLSFFIIFVLPNMITDIIYNS